ncbi:MAG: tripartite tricarboxylate transporter substrate binding protein [Alphaproteobacteria bacterium]|nr:tripartite tricarboxylate transporter substrate binding protein [Alphaproteobacteria bacterium]
MIPNFRRRDLLAWGAGAALAAPAWSQSGWPTKPVTCVVPFPAGGGTDAFARPFTLAFNKATTKNLIIDYRGGAGGTLGASVAAKMPADGYSCFMGAVHHTIAPSMYPKLDYDLERDFVPLALMATVPYVLVVNPKNLPVANLKEFLDLVKKSPGRFNYGSAGSGTAHHMAGELFKMQTQTFITHIPYRGTGPALQDLIAGNVDMMFDGLGSSAQHIRAGRIKPLMVAGQQRNASFPDIPCAGELGLKDYNVSTWYAMWMPRGTPAVIESEFIEVIKKSRDMPEIKTAWAANGADFPNLTGSAFGDFVSAETKRWAAVVKASGAKLD